MNNNLTGNLQTNQELAIINSLIQNYGQAQTLSNVLEMDSRRYIRAFTESEQVKIVWN